MYPTLATTTPHALRRGNARKADVKQVLTGGFSLCIPRALRSPPLDEPRGRKDYLDQATLRRFDPHCIVAIDPGKKALIS